MKKAVAVILIGASALWLLLALESPTAHGPAAQSTRGRQASTHSRPPRVPQGGQSKRETHAQEARLVPQPSQAVPSTPHSKPRPLPVQATVDPRAIAAYMQRFPRSSSDAAFLQIWLDEVRNDTGLQFTQDVECRGSICSAILGFETTADARALGAHDLPGNTEVVYTAILDDGATMVQAYATTPGTRFADLLAAKTPLPPSR